jgi:glutamate/tyrosine decarboxylase-like PLP-dependent enzyme
MSVQCGRKVDAFKAWFMIKARGEDYFAALVDNAFERAEYLAEQIRRRQNFDLVSIL